MTRLGVAVMVTSGTRTVTLALAPAGFSPYVPALQETLYAVLGGVGLTEANTVPEVAPPVLKPLPVQEEAQPGPPCTDHLRLTGCPSSTWSGIAVSVA